MVDQLKAACLYKMAYEMASQTPAIKNKLAGNCITVHRGMLEPARAMFGPSIEFVIGHIEMGGVQRFHFTDDEVTAWRSGTKKPRYNLHAWLALGADVLDLTLAPTIYEIDPSLLPSGITYLDHSQAAQHGISYVQRLKGDNLPIELGMLR